MKKSDYRKKPWERPVVKTLNIRKDTFTANSIPGPEAAGYSGQPPVKKS
jgi:hypothetical protein